ncbi:Endolytic murein transglycosylase [Ferriphaselus amnicola]|uniref:Endolytic murein transglycosylase n=1 Tax=Ferriphaselus amnicola TaxID=1188319 RepID=A0A2Z6GDR4_9PROT|nr:endolytic transglycosylase MltG [Ferriphaselus amnicola]BBE51315.1 Endolytic murein transglycosylase [Ferriphaselus amnicola]
MKRILLLIVVLCGLAGYYVMTPLTLVQAPISFTLKPGSSLKSAAHQMSEAGVLQLELPFTLLARALGKAQQLKAGSYELTRPVTPLRLLEMLSNGEVSMAQLSVIEGWSFRQLRTALNASPDVVHDSVNLSEAEILRRIGASETQAEGLFFPDTYLFSKGESDLAVLKQAYQAMQRNLSEQWETREQGLPFDMPYQALTLASIVEKETGAPSDRAMIASVFENRLRIGMMLQTDPTVIYGLGERFDGNLRRKDLLADTPYNTYTRGGLTPTPISLPGVAALQAVLHPAKSQALYFVARGDGTSEFSETLEQHNRAVSRYQK